MFLWSWDGNGDCPTVQRSYRKHSSDPIPPDNLGPFRQCTPGRGKVEVRLPWATSGYCFGCLLPKLAFDYAAAIIAQGKHSPGKACRSPDDGHTSLGVNGGEHSGVCRWLCIIFFQKKTFATAWPLAPLEKIPVLFESSPLPVSPQRAETQPS